MPSATALDSMARALGFADPPKPAPDAPPAAPPGPMPPRFKAFPPGPAPTATPPQAPPPGPMPPRFRMFPPPPQPSGAGPASSPSSVASSSVSAPAAGASTLAATRKTVVVDLRASTAAAAAPPPPAKPVAAAASHSIAVGDDEPLPPKPSTRSTFVGGGMPVLGPPGSVPTPFPPRDPDAPAAGTFTPAPPKQPRDAGAAAPPAARRPATTAPSTPAAAGSTAPPQPQSQQAVPESGDAVAPSMVAVMLDTEDDWAPQPAAASAGVRAHAAPAGAPGAAQPADKGTKAVRAGLRIPLPPGPAKEPPQSPTAAPPPPPHSATIETQTDLPGADAAGANGHAAPPAASKSAAAAAAAATAPAAPPSKSTSAKPVTTSPKPAAAAGAKPLQSPRSAAAPAGAAPVVPPPPPPPPKPVRLSHLPPWVAQPSASLTLLLAWPHASPALSTAGAAAAVHALLSAVLPRPPDGTAATAASGPALAVGPAAGGKAGVGTGSKLPPLTPISAALVELPAGHHLLNGLSDSVQGGKQGAAVAANGGSGKQGGQPCRALLLACVPGRQGGEAAAAEAPTVDVAVTATLAVHAWMGGAAWCPVRVAAAEQAPPCWMRCVGGAEAFVELDEALRPLGGHAPPASPTGAPPGKGSAAPNAATSPRAAEQQQHHRRGSGGGGRSKEQQLASPQGPTSANDDEEVRIHLLTACRLVAKSQRQQFVGLLPPRHATNAQVFVCSVPRLALSDARVLPAVLLRASAAGLRLRGLSTAYARDAVDASQLAARMPHRAEPRAPLAALALAGARGAAARWRAELGPGDLAVASIAEPGSVHGLLGTLLLPAAGAEQQPASGKAGAALALGCSYDARGAAAELACLFGEAEAPGQGTAQAQARAAVARAVGGVPAALQPAPLFPAAASASAAWLAFPAGDASAAAGALRALHRLADCGLGVAGAARVRAPAGLQPLRLQRLGRPLAPEASLPWPTSEPGAAASIAEGDLVLVAEVRHHEGSEQLRLCLQQASGSSPAAGVLVAGCGEADSGLVQAAAQQSVALLPATHEAAEALADADKQRQEQQQQEGSGSAAALPLADADELLVLCLQPTSAPGQPSAALLAAAELALQVAGLAPPSSSRPEGPNGGGGGSGSDEEEQRRVASPPGKRPWHGGQQAELAAVRLLRSLPQDCARRLHPVHAAGAAAAAHAPAAGAGWHEPRVHATQPSVLVVLHGSQARACAAALAEWCAAGGAAAAPGGLQAGPHPQQLVVAATQSLADARAVLATCFRPSHVRFLVCAHAALPCITSGRTHGSKTAKPLCHRHAGGAGCRLPRRRAPAASPGARRRGRPRRAAAPADGAARARHVRRGAAAPGHGHQHGGAAALHRAHQPPPPLAGAAALLACGELGTARVLLCSQANLRHLCTCPFAHPQVVRKEQFAVLGAVTVARAQLGAAGAEALGVVAAPAPHGEHVLLLRLRRSNAVQHLWRSLHKAGQSHESGGGPRRT